MIDFNTKTLSLFFLLAVILCTSCSHELYTSKWQSTKVTADGIPREWSKPLRYYEASSKLQYTFSNDKRNMYICIRVTDEVTQTKILKGGLQLWLDTTGKNKQHIGILYPMPDLTPNNEIKSEGHDRNEPGSGHLKNKVPHDLRGMELTGFKAPIGGVTPQINEYGITVEVGMDSLDILTYEAIIPFRTFYRDSLIPADSSKIISLNMVVNGVPAVQKSARDAAKDESPPDVANQGMNGQGMGARGGAGRSGGHSSAPTNPLFESHTLKTRIQLSVKNKSLF
jgi:hypothetical protein